MKELFITVSFPGMPETTYRFDTFPIRVGRSKSNDLSICHEAIPRELCTVWLEQDGRTVRVEERPGLKNPLLLGKTRMSGGISREVADLAVGPCRLSLFAAKHAAKKSFTRKRMVAILALAVVALTILATSVLDRQLSKNRAAARLPVSPFCQARTEKCNSSAECSNRAHLLLSRAREMLLRPNLKRSDRIHAAIMMTAAARLQNHTSPRDARRILQEAGAIQDKLTRQYQQDVITLRQALRQKDPAPIHQTARRLLEDLQICGDAATGPLKELVDQTRKKGSVI